MKATDGVKCFIVGLKPKSIDPVLTAHGVVGGLVVFSIPELGILFRCRAEGDPIDLEFGALFALLKFIKTKLADRKIKHLHIFSSNPEFVFSFTGNSRHLKPESERMKLLAGFNREFQMAVSFVDAIKNQALVSPADYPSMPKSSSLGLKPDQPESSQPRFEPLRKGIKL
ncbi:MAG: hypothetical protein OEV49_00915 [candidate division Zixibacteria bacterium]|nr:hypothetical protein [candidate division Zixibacteria bacterium]MDH3938594.1 hypothetical protein [candidate division Zixibacteria bacterium]MDH4032657.1 hypothetical protein [candidate division Zixibacteria bacterium]